MRRQLFSYVFRSSLQNVWAIRSYSKKASTNNCLPEPSLSTRVLQLDVLCKNAIVTGGASGIGFAAAFELLNNGAKTVIIAHPDEIKGRRAAKSLCGQFGMKKALFIPCDIRCPKQFEDLFQNALGCCDKIDIMLNNAGVIDDLNWEGSLSTNVVGTLRGMLLAYKHMSGKNSVIINTCATAGINPWPNCPIFSASKHAIVAASRCLGHPFHYNKTQLRVIGLCPSFTDTPAWNKGLTRHLKPEWGNDTLKYLSKIQLQPASLVGKAIVHLIKYGKSGKIYVCDKGVLHRAAFPREEDILCPEPLV